MVGDLESGNPSFYATADQAIEAAENVLIKASKIDIQSDQSGFNSLLLSAGFSDEQITILRDSSVVLETKDGECISKTGNLEKSFYIIDKGTVAIYQTRENEKVRLRVLMPGMIVGEMAMYSGLPRSADIISQGDATVLEINEAAVAHLELNYSDIAFKIHRILGQRLSQMVLDDSILQTVRT